MIIEYEGNMPVIADSAYISELALVSGKTTLAEETSIWPGAVVRADNDSVVIGKGSNIQDNATVHEDPGYPVVIGEMVTVGHNAVIHGCTLEDNVLVGMGAVIMDGAVIGTGSIIGAGALVTSGTKIPPYSVALGSPAKVTKQLTPEQTAGNLENAKEYIMLAANYKKIQK